VTLPIGLQTLILPLPQLLAISQAKHLPVRYPLFSQRHHAASAIQQQLLPLEALYHLQDVICHADVCLLDYEDSVSHIGLEI
jgi:hypothetical protein